MNHNNNIPAARLNKKTKLEWVYIEDSKCYIAEVKPLNWVFLIDGRSLKDKWIPCLQVKEDKEDYEVCLTFKAVELKIAKQVCQKRFDNHIAKIKKYFL